MEERAAIIEQRAYTSKQGISLPAVLVIFVIVLTSGYALTTGFNSLVTLIDIVFLLLVYIKSSPKELLIIELDFSTAVLFLMLIAIILAEIINGDVFKASAIKETIRIVVLILTAYMVSRLIEPRNFYRYFIWCMRFIVVTSLVLFVLLCFKASLFPIADNGYGVAYYTVGVFSAQVSLVDLGIVRNSALFWEPGLYAAFLMIVLLIEIILFPQGKYKRCFVAVYFAALITTGSTTAYLYIVLSITLVFFKILRGGWKYLLAGAILLAVIYVVYNYEYLLKILVEWQPHVFSKIVNGNTSLTDRLYNPLSDMLVFLHNPSGIGVEQLTNATKYYAKDVFQIEMSSRTSSLTYFFAAFGVIGGLAYNLAWGLSISQIRVDILTKVVILISIIVVAANEPLQTNTAVWLFLFMLLKQVHQQRMERDYENSLGV